MDKCGKIEIQQDVIFLSHTPEVGDAVAAVADAGTAAAA
jgi:hypothetical protein